jgi:hypothetical protein
VGKILTQVFVERPGRLPIDLLDGEPDQQGVGFFVRFGFADKETNPTKEDKSRT